MSSSLSVFSCAVTKENDPRRIANAITLQKNKPCDEVLGAAQCTRLEIYLIILNIILLLSTVLGFDINIILILKANVRVSH